jgi:hypothetical protein
MQAATFPDPGNSGQEDARKPALKRLAYLRESAVRPVFAGSMKLDWKIGVVF